MTEFNIFTLNINGLKSKQRQLFLKDFILKNNVDILCLQETHIDNYFVAKYIEKFLDLENRILWCYGHGRSKGVAIIFVNHRIMYNKFYSGLDGRLILSDFEICGNNFRIVNLYAPNVESERNTFFEQLVPHFVTSNHLILTGDFNFVFNTKLDKIGGNLERGTIGSKVFGRILTNYNLTDAFRFLFPQRKQITWCKNLGHPIIGCRLDRFYIPDILKRSIIDCNIIPCSISDHDFVFIKINLNNTLTFGKSYWKFNNSLLEDENFVSGFDYYWQIISRTDEITLKWWDKMKHKIKEFCIDYSKHKNRETYALLKQLKYAYKNSTSLEERIDIKLKISEIENNLSKGSVIRSKIKLLDSNENPSAYFCNHEHKKCHNKTITSINDNGLIHKTSNDILHSFTEFYQKLYKAEQVDSSINNHFLNNLPQVTENDNVKLEGRISKNEILDVLKKMDSTKSPGSDGLSSSFYIHFFHHFGHVLEKIIQLCFENGEMTESQKLSYITLLCKDKNDSSSMKNYRPISLLNIDRKIVSKVLSNRLSIVLPKIIGISQTCSIRGRSIFDNIHLLRNIFDYVEQKQLNACFINLDQEKAFDRVSWSYLINTLKAFGFSENFIRWINILYKDIKSSVIVNNFISKPFPVSRSVRQGCSLSPLLYVLCLEPLAKKIQDNLSIKGILVPGGQFECKMSLYADDNTSILTDDSSIKNFFSEVELYQKMSGSKINYRKSNGLYLGKWKNRSDQPFGISWVRNCKLLGYHFGYDLNIDNIWSRLFLKFSRTLNLHSKKNISFKGKSTVLNSLAFSNILYYITGNILPTHYINMFQKAAFKFIWNSAYEPVSRKTLYLPLKEGGLNIPNIELKWHSLLLSHLQKIIANNQAPWVYFAKYWIGLNLRKFNSNLANNNYPHSTEYIPKFYKSCLKVFHEISTLSPKIAFGNIPTRKFYNIMLDKDFQLKCGRLFPQINFPNVFSNIFSNSIDPCHRNICYRLAHDVVFVNYYLYTKKISKCSRCYFCNNVETVSHLFLECSHILPLNKIVLKLLQIISENKVTFSEKTFRFFDLPHLEKTVKYPCLTILSLSRSIIWHFRNLAKYHKIIGSKLDIIKRFLSQLRCRILAERNRLNIIVFLDTWAQHGICTFTENGCDFNVTMYPEYYVSKFKI